MQHLRDLVSFLALAVAVAPQAVTAAGNVDGTLIDRDTYQSQTFVLNAVLSAGTAKLVILEGDAADGSDLTAVADADVIGDPTALAASGITMLGYKGAKKYLKARVVITGSGALADVISVSCLQASGHMIGGI